MSWRLSRFRTGGLVEVRSKEEILATLDGTGALDAMPFMPEMLQYCGRRFRVGAVAHKTCETAHRTLKTRRLESTVHLEGLRCDGSAHGGCEAECLLFWKDAWLRPIDDRSPRGPSASSEPGGCTYEQLLAATQIDTDEPRYACQATRLWDATAPLPWWNPWQYLRDFRTGNRSARRVLRVLWFAALNVAMQRTPRGARLIRFVRMRSHRWLMGREVPDFQGLIERRKPTPVQPLGLKCGDRVRIKSKEEIVRTIDVHGRNRGLYFDIEMSRHCGTVATVRRRVSRIIDEETGTMRHMKQPCIMLEGVACDSDYSTSRLLCPRAIPSYWREIWLDRIDDTISGPTLDARPVGQGQV
jgi:hypothetical protein